MRDQRTTKKIIGSDLKEREREERKTERERRRVHYGKKKNRKNQHNKFQKKFLKMRSCLPEIRGCPPKMTQT